MTVFCSTTFDQCRSISYNIHIFVFFFLVYCRYYLRGRGGHILIASCDMYIIYIYTWIFENRVSENFMLFTAKKPKIRHNLPLLHFFP